jgi:hypothetical protein
MSRNGKEEKAASRFPSNNCQVPNPTTHRVNMIMKIAAGLFMRTIITNINVGCPDN